ncbi:pre-peptidase [Halococcus sp. IIIV-5B]|uniref:pre-peptidase n=1 Tax=Halococcus sp. IIIV-5B TaxID=2321230 RepID=UPI000E74FC4D|nr:pre-peptidase [Halococcus sp. IIIV-5B]RJS97607.1 pre-peptidase [Halococcus sp. IIIV-5B]
MKSNNAPRDADDSQSVDVSRRKFLAASAVGVAGLGAVGSAAAAPDEHTLVIEGTGTKSNYLFTAGDNLKKSTADGATIDGDATITNNSAHGLVGSGKDAYTFDGNLLAFNFDGAPINVLLDGEPAHVGMRPDHFVEIEGTGPATHYTFSVNANVEKSSGHGATFGSEDRIFNDGVTASGRVNSGKDAYTFYDNRLDSNFLAFNFDGAPINVLLNGKPAHVGQNYEHLLQIQGTGSPATYNFTVSGPPRLAQTSKAGGSIDDGDTYMLREAEGMVTNESDVYRFNGKLRTFDLDGRANVLVDGEAAHVGQIPDR